NLYVAGNKKLPYKEVLAMVGLIYDEKFEKEEIGLGGFNMGFNPKTSRAVIFELDKTNSFSKKMGYKEYDDIVSFNGKSITLDNYKEVLFGFLHNAKTGDKLVVEVARKIGKEKKGKERKEKIKTLSATVAPAKVSIPNNI